MNPLSSSHLAVQRAWAYNEAFSEFGGNENKAGIAADAFVCGAKYIRSMPIGWNINNTTEDFEDKLHEHIKCNLDAKPYGFFALPIVGWMFWKVLGGLVNWAVSKLMHVYFPDKK